MTNWQTWEEENYFVGNEVVDNKNRDGSAYTILKQFPYTFGRAQNTPSGKARIDFAILDENKNVKVFVECKEQIVGGTASEKMIDVAVNATQIVLGNHAEYFVTSIHSAGNLYGVNFLKNNPLENMIPNYPTNNIKVFQSSDDGTAALKQLREFLEAVL